ncbi:cytochrome c biogenesis CcdA family protein [Phreatobacter sp.]|uniref:cytochrome c biogenesis CcdA family protein n=1 Tax=Phreatobacter sp. TaxID=1966341 RepID=UPI003F6EFBFC
MTFAGAFVGGLASFFSPCILPLTPAYLGFLTGSTYDQIAGGVAEAGLRRRLVVRSLAFVLGFSVVFILLGATASALGQAFSHAFDWLAVVAGLAIAVLGLHLTGLVTIPILAREARAGMERRPAGLAGAFGIGLAFGFGWAPCVGPVLAAILLMAARTDTLGQGIALLAAYAAGMGLPFIVAAAFAGPFLSWMARVRHRLATIQTVTGWAMVVTGLLIASGQMPRIGGWLVEIVPLFGRVG